MIGPCTGGAGSGDSTRASTWLTTPNLGHGLNVYCVRSVVSGFFSFFFLVFGELVLVPGLVAEGGVGDALGIDHDLLGRRLEGGTSEIGGRDLERIEEEAGGFGIDLVGKQQTQGLHERDLDGVSVLEDRHVERVTGAARLVGANLETFLVPMLVKVAVFAALQGW